MTKLITHHELFCIQYISANGFGGFAFTGFCKFQPGSGRPKAYSCFLHFAALPGFDAG
jgi:hypothetical protein